MHISATYEDNFFFIEGIATLDTEKFKKIFIYIKQPNPNLSRILGQDAEPPLFGLPSKPITRTNLTLVFQASISGENSTNEYIRLGRWINYLARIGKLDSEINKYLERSNGQDIDDRALFKDIPDFDD
jgi:hypothetical protein